MPPQEQYHAKMIVDQSTILEPSKMSKRDNDYYARQLQRKHPQIWHDFQTGVHKTMAEARRAAGLGGERSRLHELKNAWSKATDEQRDEFLAFLDAQGITLPRKTPAPAPVPTVSALTPAPTSKPTSSAGSSTSASTAGVGFTFARDGYLTPEAKDRINQIIDQRGLRGRYGAPKTGVIMKELNPAFSSLDASLGSALSSGTSLKKSLINALEA